VTGELILVGDTAIRFRVEGDASGDSAAVFGAGIRARGSMPAPHIHHGFEETVYGLEGLSTWRVDGTTVDVAPGQALCIRRRVVQHLDNRGDVDANVLAIITPGVLGPGSFREVAAVFADDPAAPPHVARIGEVTRRHGLTRSASSVIACASRWSRG
jgi:mannose-6-phosphate isomerase-like protein (cupin superfamily)